MLLLITIGKTHGEIRKIEEVVRIQQNNIIQESLQTVENTHQFEKVINSYMLLYNGYDMEKLWKFGYHIFFIINSTIFHF